MTTPEAKGGGAPPLGRHAPAILFAVACIILGGLTLLRPVLHHPHGDYPTWYAIGRLALAGGNVYPIANDGTFAFLYPPFAALLLAPLTIFGREGMIFVLVLVNVASWWAAVHFSRRLSAVAEYDCGLPKFSPRPWWLIVLPSLLWISYIYDMFDLGQPNLLLLALMLAGLALLRSGRNWPAGAAFAAATALKAFPIAVLPYLLWRRRYRRAALAMIVFTIAFLVLAPAPFRGLRRSVADLSTWSRAMVFSAGEQGFGQRPEQNWSWKNQSLIAVTHRFLRPVNAEMENPAAKPIYVNFANLSYDAANRVLAAIALLIGIGFVLALPPERRRTRASDGCEFALLIALMTIVSPLARAYYFVWLLFPLTVLIDRAVSHSQRRVRRVTWGWLIVSFVLFTAGAPFGQPHWPQALGDALWGSAVIIGLLAWHLRRDAKPAATATVSF